MNWKIYINGSVEKQIKNLPKHYADKIKKAIDFMEFDPFVGDIEKMGDKENIWRRRVGQYRIFYEINNQRKIVFIFDVKRRTSNTY